MAEGQKVTIHGGCLCGSVTWEYTSPIPIQLLHCFCRSCRVSSSSFFQPFFNIHRDSKQYFHIHDPTNSLRIYSSRPSSVRTFCSQCSTPITWEHRDPNGDVLRIAPMASTIKEDDLIEYTKLDILCHVEDTPNRRGGPPDLSKWKGVEIYADSIAGPKAELLQPEVSIGKGGMPYVLKGGCFCGKARYTIEMPTADVVGQKKGELEGSGWPDDCGRKVEGSNWFWTVSYCHCSQCRLSSSCPATPFLLIPSTLFKLTVNGEDQPLSFPEPLAALSSYNSSTNPNKSPCFRHFCPACFTSLFDLSDSKTIDVYAGTLDDEYLAWVREERRIWLEDGSGGRVWRVFGKGLDDGLKWFEQNRLSNRIK